MMAMKNRIIGACALCLRYGPLELSHLLAEGISKRLRSPNARVKEPILVTRTVTISTSRQVRDYLLCRNCEGRFDRLGENYVLAQMYSRGRFPLLDRLRISPAVEFSLREGIYSGPGIGIDTEKLAYFALSVIWRSAVHEWRAPDGHSLASIDLGVYQEPIRRYLLGEGSFPSDVAVVVNVCTDFQSQGIAYYPTRRRGIQATAFAFLACGIHFTAYLGPTVPPVQRLCCFSSPQKLIFSRDIGQIISHVYSNLASTSRAVGLMADT
jgi:hypothetical protein